MRLQISVFLRLNRMIEIAQRRKDWIRAMHPFGWLVLSKVVRALCDRVVMPDEIQVTPDLHHMQTSSGTISSSVTWQGA